ncbi:MAG: 50S ribosomal protein L4 [Candidatus Omnitrophota bacterium]
MMAKVKSKEQINRIPLFDSGGKKIESIELDKDIFNGEYNESLLYQSVRMYRANQRSGTASTKTRGDVRGAGKKPWRQKGTGRARFGSIRNPLWRGGGIAFGPHPRDFRYTLPKKMRKAAFISSLNAKLKSGKIAAVRNLVLEEPKTKKVSALLEGLGLKAKGVLFLVKSPDRNLVLASRNIRKLTLKEVDEATALDVLSSENVIMTKEAAWKFMSKKDGK